jgi:excisionase family DNA binding protein
MNPNTIEAALLTTTEAGRMLGVDRRTIVLMCQRGDLPAVRIGEAGRWRVIRSGVDRIVRAEPVVNRGGVLREVRPASPREATNGGEAA